MKNGVHHRDLAGGVPVKAVQAFLGEEIVLDYSRHAMLAAIEDRYSRSAPWKAPKSLRLQQRDIVEAEVQYDAAVKAVVRIPVDMQRDLVLVLSAPDGNNHSTVRTLWLNSADDKHYTLDSSKYANA